MHSYPLPLPLLLGMFLLLLAPLVIIARRSSALQSKWKGYVDSASAPGSQLPPEVRAVFDEAKARATAIPRDAQAIALDYSRQVPPAYRENLVRLVYFTVGCAQGMDPRDAVRYAGKMWAQTSLTD